MFLKYILHLEKKKGKEEPLALCDSNKVTQEYFMIDLESTTFFFYD